MADSNEVNATQGAVDHAADNGVDISKVVGTGADGKVTKPDVQAHIDAQAAPAAPEAPVTPEAPVPAPVPAPAAPAKGTDPELQAAWEGFLADAEANALKNGTSHIFNAQKERGEFATPSKAFTEQFYGAKAKVAA